MEFFQKLRRDNSRVTYFFFPSAHVEDFLHFLKEECITGWNMVTKEEALYYVPEGKAMRTTYRDPVTKRVEKNTACLVSHYSPNDMAAAYSALVNSDDWVERQDEKARMAARDYEFENAMARDPGPLNPFRPE